MSLLLACRESVPVLHGSLCAPVAHLLHLVDPSSDWLKPGAHIVHSFAWALSAKLPGLQSSHARCPADRWKRPGLHAEHEDFECFSSPSSKSMKSPGGHLAHDFSGLASSVIGPW
jgi:hypothetical protein